jgi:hypothetical protein
MPLLGAVLELLDVAHMPLAGIVFAFRTQRYAHAICDGRPTEFPDAPSSSAASTHRRYVPSQAEAGMERIVGNEIDRDMGELHATIVRAYYLE